MDKSEWLVAIGLFFISIGLLTITYNTILETSSCNVPSHQSSFAFLPKPTQT